ncbi:MAG: GNAT family N-acetyltransferase [Betaproteobacteria bacterium]
MPAQTYPAHLVLNWSLSDGTRIVIRPIRPEDRQIEQEFVHNLSEEAKYFRFFSALHELTERMLTRSTEVDYDQEMALIAASTENGHEVEIGVARYVINADDKSCEFAIVVAHAWQHRGIGRTLMICLMQAALSRGLQVMEGFVLAANHKMLGLMNALGFTIEPATGDATLKLVRRDLTGVRLPALPASAIQAA